MSDIIPSPLSLKGAAEAVHGWVFIGLLINVLLLGVMITQVYLYYTQYKNDKLWMKTFVAALFFADIVNTIFGSVYLYRSLITFYGDIKYLNTADWLFATDPATTGIIATAVQLFFAWRVLVLTKTWAYTAIIGVVAIAGGVASIVTAYEIGKTPLFANFRDFKPAVIVWLAAEAVGDIVITSVLRKHKTGFQHSDMVIDKIIRATIQTGLITMIVASVDLVFYLSDPRGTHFMLCFPLCKLYSNSLMSSLNSRGGWKFNNSATTNSSVTAASDMEGGTVVDSRGQITLQLKNGSKVHNSSQIRTHPSEVLVHVESRQQREMSVLVSNSDTSFDEKPKILDPESQK